MHQQNKNKKRGIKKYFFTALIAIASFVVVPHINQALAQEVPPTNPVDATNPLPSEFANPLQYDTIPDAIGSILVALQDIIVTLSIIFIIIGAILYITSAGNEKRMSNGRMAITAAMIGLALGIAAPSFLREIASILGWNNTPSTVSAALSLTQIVLNILNFLLGIVGILTLIMLVVGASMYITAAGDEHKIDSGKNIVKYSLIGIIVAFAAMIIVKQIAFFFTA